MGDEDVYVTFDISDGDADRYATRLCIGKFTCDFDKYLELREVCYPGMSSEYVGSRVTMTLGEAWRLRKILDDAILAANSQRMKNGT